MIVLRFLTGSLDGCDTWTNKVLDRFWTRKMILGLKGIASGNRILWGTRLVLVLDKEELSDDLDKRKTRTVRLSEELKLGA